MNLETELVVKRLELDVELARRGPKGDPGALAVEQSGTPVAGDVNTINFFGAGANVIDSGGGVVAVEIPGGGSGAIPNWDSMVVYSEGDLVIYQNNLYQSLSDDNEDYEPDNSPEKWQLIGAVSPIFPSGKVVLTDENGELSTQWLEYGEDTVEIPIPPTPVNIVANWIRSNVQTLTKFGAFKLPPELGNSELFGLLVEPDGTTPASLSVVDMRIPYSPFQVGAIDGEHFGLIMVRPDQSPIILVTDNGFKLGEGATVDRIDTFLSSANDKLPTSGAVLAAINAASSVSADSFLDNAHVEWFDVVDTSTDITIGSTSNGSDITSSGSTRHRVSLANAATRVSDVDEMFIRIWIDSGSADVYGVVYEDDGGQPGNLLYTSDLVTVSNTSNQEVSFPFSSPFDVEAGTSLWIGYRNITSDGTLHSAGDVGGINLTYSSSGSSPDDPFNMGVVGTNTGTLNAYLVGHPDSIEAVVSGFVESNNPIAGATKTKITYDAKGLVTAGADATTADINDSSNRRYVTDAQLTVISNTSGTNTGDQDLSGLMPKATISASGKGFVNHGSVAGTARPTGYASVEWFGTVEPTNMTNADTWIRPS